MTTRTLLLALLAASASLAGCLADDPAAQEDTGSDDLAVAPVPVPPGTYDFSGPYSRVLQPGPLGILPAEHVEVPSPIGGDIELGLHLPDTEEPVPVLAFASPYFFAEGSPGGARTVLDRGGSFGSLVENFVPHGYAVAAVAVRGTAGSSGCNDLMGPQETIDLDAAVTWLGEQPWSSGAVAMTGVSYDGSTPWGVASVGNPYLKTIVPISGVPDMYGLMYRNGSSESRGPVLLNALYVEGSIGSAPAGEEMLTRAACPDALAGVGLSGVAGVTGEDPTGYWQERNRKPGVEANYQGSVFSVQGLQDWNVDPSQVVPWVDELERQGIRTKQLLGQWGHAWPDYVDEDMTEPDYRADWKESLLRWLDQELKGKTVDTGPAVQVRDDLGRWRNEEHYPPHDTTWTDLHLTADGKLRPQAGATGSHLLVPNTPLFGPIVDPADYVDTPVEHYVDFTSLPMPKDTLVVGLPKVHVTVTPHAPGGYIAAYLYERTDEGDRRIGWTSMDLAFADGGRERKEVVPGEPIQALMEIQPMDSVVRAGNELVLRVWVFTDGDRIPTIPPGTMTLEVGPAVESVLRLPTVERGPEAYFEPPLPA